MKELVAGIVLIVVVGLGGFLYRNMLERNMVPQPDTVACTMEAKICPDGSSVGREGPSCEFAPCPGEGSGLQQIGVSLTPPPGYTANPNALGADATLVATFEKPGVSNTQPPHAIVVRRYAIPEGQTADDVLLATTMLEPSGMTPELGDFETITIGGKVFKKIVVERFEAQVHSVYYFIRAADVLRFEILERDVTNWTDPNLVITNLPEHQAFLSMLAALTITQN